MKYLLMLVVVVLAYVGALAGALFATGNLTTENVNKLIGREEEPELPPETDEATPLIRQLEQRAQALAERERAIQDREQRVSARERELEETQERIEALQAQVNRALEQREAQEQARLAEVADSVGAMKAPNAAETLESLPPEDAASILRQVDEKDRGKILDEMDVRKRTLVLGIMQHGGNY